MRRKIIKNRKKRMRGEMGQLWIRTKKGLTCACRLRPDFYHFITILNPRS